MNLTILRPWTRAVKDVTPVPDPLGPQSNSPITDDDEDMPDADEDEDIEESIEESIDEDAEESTDKHDDSQEEGSNESPSPESPGNYAGLALRGGVLQPPPNLPWSHRLIFARAAQARQQDDNEDDNESTSSDWDSYGAIPDALQEYGAKTADLEGLEHWNAEQQKLHKLIYMRGLHPVMPSWWRVSFKMWGITQPHLDDLFTPRNSKKRVVIHAYGSEVAAAKALESLFYLSQNVTDYEEIGYESKIAPTVVKTLRGYIRWALRDAGIDERKSLLNMIVRAYPPDWVERGSAGEESDTDLTTTDEDEGPYDAEARRVQRFTQAVSRDLERRLRQLGQKWRDSLTGDKAGKKTATPTTSTHQPPTLYAFAVIQHIVLLASLDPSKGDSTPVVVLEQIPLNDRSQWLWNALSLALPVNLARDVLCGLWNTGNIVALQPSTKDDPDL